jgi:hypothetical protein
MQAGPGMQGSLKSIVFYPGAYLPEKAVCSSTGAQIYVQQNASGK